MLTSAFNDEFDEGHAVEEFQLKVWAKEEVRFDGPMENHCLASQPNRREKYGDNMKTSMKELQRDRTQLSTWISALTDARSKIEARMMKVKTFSVTC